MNAGMNVGGEIPDGMDLLTAITVKVNETMSFCPKCGELIVLNKENKYHYICKCKFDWTCLVSYHTIIPIKDSIENDNSPKAKGIKAEMVDFIDKNAKSLLQKAVIEYIASKE